MSETEQREVELVAGVVEGITQKGTDKWQVSVKPDGSQYAKNLWTKDGQLVSALSAKIGQAGTFVCEASHWTNSEGKPVRSLWIQTSGPDGEVVSNVSLNPADSVATPDAAPHPGPGQSVFSTTGEVRPTNAPGYKLPEPGGIRPPVLGGDKDRLIVRQVCIKAAAELIAGNLAAADHPALVAEDPALNVMKAAQRFETWIYRDIADVPFDGRPDLSEHDQSIPF